MTSDAQSTATGLLDQMRDVSNLDKLHSVFDARVADALNRMGVPSKSDIEALNAKLDKILAALGDSARTPAKKKRASGDRPSMRSTMNTSRKWR